jgi:hypothetical protein
VVKIRKTKQGFQVDDEVPLSSICNRTKEEHLGQALKNVASLEDLTLESRKKEASKPFYLIRYE